MNAVTELPEARQPLRVRDVAAEVLAVLRLAFTLRLDARQVQGRDVSIALLGAVALLVWAVLGYVDIHGAAKFEPAGLVELASLAAAAVGLAWLLARLSRPPLPIRQTLWLVAGYLPAVAAVGWVLIQPLSRARFIGIVGVCAAHAALYFYFGLRAFGARPAWPPFAAFAVATLAVIALCQRSQLDFALWSPRQSAEQLADYRESEQRAEELLYGQSERIDAAIDAIPAGAADQAQVYFVGFAGFGPQKVFAQEIALAAQRIDERYASANRQVLLVNDRRDYDRLPLASNTALARTLAGIGARMNRERDVLFLALSSHGKRDPYLVVENGALPLNRLTAERLAAMLRESQIRWKILVISACYGGAFIEPLRDPYTVIITAAAPDKASFGCNDRRALTYFGEAFYQDALPGAASLREAFDVTVANIERRESAEDLEPSRPQAHFGAEMERKLAELEVARVTRSADRLGPQPAESSGQHQRVDQPVEHELDGGAPLARVPDGVVQQPE